MRTPAFPITPGVIAREQALKFQRPQIRCNSGADGKVQMEEDRLNITVPEDCLRAFIFMGEYV